MPTYLAPGVYLEELQSERQAVVASGVGADDLLASRNEFAWTTPGAWLPPTVTAAFVGFAEQGPMHTPWELTSLRDFASVFGKPLSGGFLATTVEGFFANGGTRCFVVRTGSPSNDGTELSSTIGDAADRTGFAALEVVDGIDLVAAPDLMALFLSGRIDAEGVRAGQVALIAHAEMTRDRVAILDTPPGLGAREVLDWRQVGGIDSSYAAMYYPWIRTMDDDAGRLVAVPPCGHVAGVIARSDRRFGPLRPPSNEELTGTVNLESVATIYECGVLNPYGINVIVSRPGRAPVVLGSRTLSSDPEWRSLAVRRQVCAVESSIIRGTTWMLSAGSSPPELLANGRRAAREIGDYLHLLWLSGMLGGAEPRDAYFVRCDERTCPPEVLDAGQVRVEVGFTLGVSGYFRQFHVVYVST